MSETAIAPPGEDESAALLSDPGGMPFRAFAPRQAGRQAGRHLILDLWGANRLDQVDHIGMVMREAVAAVGATLLHLHLHHFNGGNGVSGVAVLAESHLSIHTWPEWDFAALDLFVCGALDPLRILPVLRAGFAPKDIQIAELWRGQGPLP